MKSPIVLGKHDTHLDGILAWSWVCRKFGSVDAVPIERSSNRDDAVKAKLPLLKIGTIYACSIWQFPHSAKVSTATWTRRRDPQDKEQRIRRIDPGGPERDLLLSRCSVATPYVEWLAIGNRRKVKDLLRRIRSVGCVRSHGWGTVDKWEIERVDASVVDTITKGQKAARNIPLSMLERVEPSNVEMLAVEPPYWLPAMRVPAVRPGTKVELLPLCDSF